MLTRRALRPEFRKKYAEIIDTEEVIRHTDINADYTIRPETAETLNTLKKIS
jgi:hypothetical protein